MAPLDGDQVAKGIDAVFVNPILDCVQDKLADRVLVARYAKCFTQFLE
jgi:hypothetical protein